MRDEIYVFEDRYDAGRRLAGLLAAYKDTGSFVLAIPSGGVPVASEVASALNLPMDLIITRKLRIPHNPEAGFGAVGPGGESVLNETLLGQLRLSSEEIEAETITALSITKRQDQVFRKGKPFPLIADKTVIIVDDGLASGYTMLAAVRFLKKMLPRKIVAAVPTGLERTINLLLPDLDELACLNVRSGFSFAVAEAYRTWYNLTEDEVLSLIKKFARSPSLP